MTTTLKLVGVAFACAVVTGIRGGLFTIAMTRLNVRIRSALFGSLLRQEIGFYDTSKTGVSLPRSGKSDAILYRYLLLFEASIVTYSI